MAGRRGAAAWRRRCLALPVVPVAAAAVAAFVGARLLAHGGDPSVFVLAGRWSAPGPVAGGLHVVPGAGYDGQFAYALALHPLTHSTTVGGITLDKPSYRAGRVLLPALAHLVAFSGLSMAFCLILVNGLALVGLAAAAGVVVGRSGRAPVLGVLVALTPGLLLGLARSTTEPLAALLIVLTLMAWSARRPVWMAAAGTGAVLARETAAAVLIALAAVAAWRLLRREPRFGRLLVAALTPLLALLLWQLHLRAVWGVSPASAGGRNLGAPVVGLVHDMVPPYRPAGSALSVALTWELERVWLLLLLGTALVVAAGRSSRFAALRGAFAATAAVALCARSWREDAAFLRVTFDAAVLATLLLLCVRSAKLARPALGVGVAVSVAVAGLHVVNP